MDNVSNLTSEGRLNKVPGQHEYDGILYLPTTPRSHLESIKNVRFTSEDLLVATFSKSGSFLQGFTWKYRLPSSDPLINIDQS